VSKFNEQGNVAQQCANCVHRKLCPILRYVKSMRKGELTLMSTFYCADFLAVLAPEPSRE